jgi:hypothetical protein
MLMIVVVVVVKGGSDGWKDLVGCDRTSVGVCHDKTYRLVIDGFADVQTIRCKVSIARCRGYQQVDRSRVE